MTLLPVELVEIPFAFDESVPFEEIIDAFVSCANAVPV
jgi:hypothetical protein